MKKFLIAIIFLIPIMVMLSLQATGVAIAKATNVPAERIELRDLVTNKELDYDLTLNRDLLDKDYISFSVVSFPTIAYDKNVLFEISETSSGLVRVEKIGTEGYKYRLIPEKSGDVEITLYSKSNINAYKTLNLYISVNRIGTFSISIGDNVLENGATCQITENSHVYADFFPLEALGDNLLNYAVLDTSIADINQNGYLTIKKRGITELSISALDKTGYSHTAKVFLDTSDTLVTTDKVYAVTEPTIDYILSHYVLDPNATVSKVPGGYRVTNGLTTVDLSLILTTDEEWQIDDTLPALLFLQNGGYQLGASYLTKKEDCLPIFRFSDDSKIRLDGNRLIPLERGTVTLYATLNGVEKFLDLEIRDVILDFSLNLSQKEAKRGIAEDRIWAYNWLDSNMQATIHSYQLSIPTASIVPAGSIAEIIWIVDNPNFATVSPSGLVTFLPAVCGNSVTVTAVSVIGGRLSRVRKSFSFVVLPDQNAINANTFLEFVYAAEIYNQVAVIQNDITNDDWQNNNLTDNVNISNDVYGNGFVIYNKLSRDHIGRTFLRLDYDFYKKDSFLFYNCVIYANDIEKPSLINGISIRGHQAMNDRELLEELAVTFRYCLVAYAQSGISLSEWGDVNLEGCIFSNIASAAIYSDSFNADILHINVNKVILRDSIGPGIMLMGVQKDGKQVEGDSFSPITIDGFYDAYNWFKKEEIGDAFKVIDFSDLNLPEYPLGDVLAKEVSNLFVQVLSEKQYSHLKMEYKGNEFYHLAGLVVGLWCQPNPDNLHDNTNSFVTLPLAFTYATKITLMGISFDLKAIEGLISKYLNGGNSLSLTNPSYFISGHQSGNQNILPDSVCPSNSALYARLRA